jgi:YD repeat-containing protein
LPDINNGDDGCNASSPSNLTDYPINIATGNKYFTNRYLNDVGIVGIDPIRLDLFYNSNTDSQIWTHTYSRSLIIEADSIKSKRANGQVFVFANNQGVIVGLPRRLEKLVKIVNSIDNHPALAVYKLSLPNKTVELYNESGQLLSIDYPSGIRHKLIYSTSSSRVYVWHQSDSSATDFNYIVSLYISDNKITRATYNRTTIAFHYDQVDGIDRLLTATYAGGGTKTYLYENTIFPHYITGILDENGNRISSVQYDDQGRAISSEMGELGSGIERSQITYHEDGTRTVTNALGKQNIYHFTQFNSEYKMTQVEGQASTNCASANQAYTYDTNGFMASKTDWKGNVTTYIHNNRGQELSRTEASGTPEVRTIVTEWHVTFNLPTKIIEPERETLFSYDSDGRLTSKEINPR